MPTCNSCTRWVPFNIAHPHTAAGEEERAGGFCTGKPRADGERWTPATDTCPQHKPIGPAIARPDVGTAAAALFFWGGVIHE